MGFNSIDSWKQFGASSLNELAESENDRGMCMYAWLYQRSSDSQKIGLPEPISNKQEAPPPRFVPVLQVLNNQGVLGFLAVDSGGTYKEPNTQGQLDEYRGHAYNAAKIVFDLFHIANPALGSPKIEELELHEGGGTSLSLPAMFAALGRILDIT